MAALIVVIIILIHKLSFLMKVFFFFFTMGPEPFVSFVKKLKRQRFFNVGFVSFNCAMQVESLLGNIKDFYNRVVGLEEKVQSSYPTKLMLLHTLGTCMKTFDQTLDKTITTSCREVTTYTDTQIEQIRTNLNQKVSWKDFAQGLRCLKDIRLLLEETVKDKFTGQRESFLLELRRKPDITLVEQRLNCKANVAITCQLSERLDMLETQLKDFKEITDIHHQKCCESIQIGFNKIEGLHSWLEKLNDISKATWEAVGLSSPHAVQLVKSGRLPHRVPSTRGSTTLVGQVDKQNPPGTENGKNEFIITHGEGAIIPYTEKSNKYAKSPTGLTPERNGTPTGTSEKINTSQHVHGSKQDCGIPWDDDSRPLTADLSSVFMTNSEMTVGGVGDALVQHRLTPDETTLGDRQEPASILHR